MRMKVYLYRLATNSQLVLKFNEPMDNQEIEEMVAKDYPGWAVINVVSK